MAKKQPGNEEANGGVVFDQRTKAVMATNHITTDNVKAKITKVRESVANNVKKDDIVIVLQHFDNDTTKAIEAFNAGKTESILETWSISGKKGGKGTQQGRNKRRRNRQGNQNVNNAEKDAIKTESIPHPSSKQPAGSNSTEITKETTSSAKDTAVRLPQPNDNNNKTSQPNLNHPTDRGKSPSDQRQQRDQSPRHQPPQPSRPGERQGDWRNRRTQGRNLWQEQKERGGPNAQNNSRRREGGRGGVGPGGDRRVVRDGHSELPDVQESESSETSGQGKKKGAHLERLEKDLHRTTVSLQRCENNLSTQLDDSEKRLKKAFEEVRRQLHERELVLLNDFNDIKRQTESLIDTRIKTASELKMKIAKANSLSEQELLELRASLKHFVSDRKTDEEIAQTMRFTYTPDPLIAEVKKYGEVNMEISRYSSRRPSISSLSSISRTTSVCEDIPQTLSRGVSLSESLKSPDSTSPKSPDMDLSVEADNFAAKLQQKIKARGSGPPRNGPRNQPGGRGAGRRRENSGSKDQGRRPQGNQEGPRRPQNRGNQEANRKRTDSGSAQKNNDGQKESSGENQRPPRREGRGRGGSRGGHQQARAPRTEGKPEQAESKVVEGGSGDNQTESPKKQRNFTRRNQHRRRQEGRQGNDGRQGSEGPQGGDSPKKVEGKEREASETSKPQDNGPKVTENGPKSPDKPVEVVKNGPTVPNGEAKVTPPSIKIANGGGSESAVSVESTPASSPGKDSRSSEPLEKKVIPSKPLTNGSANGDDNAAEVNHHEETSTSSTEAKKIIEREKMESAVKESVVMVNGDSKVEGEIKGKDCEEDGGEK
ncbi:uncharacterized protein [Apostichopus japonicus]|uniref:uncharacterized protein isoform X2 n=1 Tax=Stichopus japonicus TaxID=307972 RepID=UPI003AB66E62